MYKAKVNFFTTINTYAVKTNSFNDCTSCKELTNQFYTH